MKKNALTTIKYFIITIFVTLAVTLPTVNAQDPPIFPDGSRIEGTWNMQPDAVQQSERDLPVNSDVDAP